ncbi:MAG: hypothetical protein B6D41_10505 [Chloroflexi bacterium UTCFX4]|jgi:signal transduction histidine kinase|nr:MAG: hypothetical protein B6D41_10505 [Chloroflexi bacterium UTCFX4]
MSVQVTTDVNAIASQSARARRRWLWLAQAFWIICAALALLIFLAGIPLGYALLFSGAGFNVPIDAPAWYIASMSVVQGIVSLAAALVSLALAGIVFWKKRADPGALFVSFYLLAYGVVLAGPLEALNGFPPLFPGASAPSGMLIPTNLVLALQASVFIPAVLLFFLFPTGHFVPVWTRYAALALLLIAPLFVYVTINEWLPRTTPLAWFTFAMILTLLGAGIYSQVYRYRRVASRVERQQTKWVVFGIVLTFFLVSLTQIPYAMVAQIPMGESQPWWVPLSSLIWWITISILPFSLAIAVLGYRLWDIDIIINRALVYGALTAFVVGMYIVSVGAFSALFQTSGNLFVSLLATAAIAILFQPLRERLQRGVNRLMYGERDDPYRVLTRLGAQLENAMEPFSALTQTVETVAAALKLPYVAIALEQDGNLQTVAAHGTAPQTVNRFPLIHAGEPIGELVAAPRTANETLTPADERLLRDLARQISIAARTAVLTSDLEQARLRIVTERGEARRQLASDLHDGVGHQLVGLTRQIENATPKVPDSAALLSIEFLADLKRRVIALTTQVRGLAHQLYPPELDVLGLSGALREHADSYSTFRVLFDAPTSLPRLPAEIETAAYYIVLEALTNVDKHANAKTCTIRLRLSAADLATHVQWLEFDIVDDGRGFTANETRGLGLLSMRARAAEVGGACHILQNRGGGTAVFARIPCILKVE